MPTNTLSSQTRPAFVYSGRYVSFIFVRRDAITARLAEIAERLAQATNGREDVAEAENFYGYIGDVQVDTGNPHYVNLEDRTAAIGYSEKALAMAANLAILDKQNVLTRSDLAMTYARLGDVLSEKEPRRALVF